jgi:CubicO group peptidase (beta-lactamase class C family)
MERLLGNDDVNDDAPFHARHRRPIMYGCSGCTCCFLVFLCGFAYWAKQQLDTTGATCKTDTPLGGVHNFTAETHPINKFQAQMNTIKNQASGTYWAFSSYTGEEIYTGEVQGLSVGITDSWYFPDDTVWMASASKLFTAFAAMYTFELKPDKFYPEKYLHEFNFSGWDRFKNFGILGTHKQANLTLHHLLTHTSGIPFSMAVDADDILKMDLFYEPGTAFGYTIGHRLIGWLLRDFWKLEAPEAKITTVEECFRWLYWDTLGLTETSFTKDLAHFFKAFGESQKAINKASRAGESGDATIQSSGTDFMKLAVVALRKGRMLDGTPLISEKNWKKWAEPNLLPGGNLTADLVSWQTGDAFTSSVGVPSSLKAKIMTQAGPYGWNYFGATYYGYGQAPFEGKNGMKKFQPGTGLTFKDRAPEIGWCGFFSSCLHVSYTRDTAFAMTQRDVSDLKKSKAYMLSFYDSLSSSLMCSEDGASANDCFKAGHASTFCQVTDEKKKTVQTEKNDVYCPHFVQAARTVLPGFLSLIPGFPKPQNFWPLCPNYKFACYKKHCPFASTGSTLPPDDDSMSASLV